MHDELVSPTTILPGQAIDYIALAHSFLNAHPLYFDNAGLWWRFNGITWEQQDDIDVLGSIHSAFQWNGIVNTQVKTQALTALKVVSRNRRPDDPPVSAILTKSGVYDLATKETHLVTANQFFTNCIPWKIGASDECPTIDALMESWVGNKKEQLLELMAYCLYRQYPIQRIFCLLGSGGNGKGSFVRLLSNLLGQDNVTSFSLKRLVMDKFQTAKVYNKLVGVATEIDYGLMENTSVLKSLVGGDPIPIEFKNKNPFDFYNYAKIIVSANSLPATIDRTPGFYRRWLIIDFPNRFHDGKDVTDSIPDWEFENLLRRLLTVLERVLQQGSFTDEGTVETKQQRYEEKSNPVQLFVQEYCISDTDGFIPMYEFRDKFSAFVIQHGYRKLSDREVWGLLELVGIERGRDYVEFGDGTRKQVRGLIGLGWKNKTHKTPLLVESLRAFTQPKSLSYLSHVSQTNEEKEQGTRERQESTESGESRESVKSSASTERCWYHPHRVAIHQVPDAYQPGSFLWICEECKYNI